MSRCTECRCEMDDFDAQRYETCAACRKRGRYFPVRDWRFGEKFVPGYDSGFIDWKINDAVNESSNGE